MPYFLSRSNGAITEELIVHLKIGRIRENANFSLRKFQLLRYSDRVFYINLGDKYVRSSGCARGAEFAFTIEG
jgi:hypothetical protein